MLAGGSNLASAVNTERAVAEVRELMERSRELKAAGKLEESGRLAAEARELRARLGAQAEQKRDRPPEGGRSPGVADQQAQAKAKAGELEARERRVEKEQINREMRNLERKRSETRRPGDAQVRVERDRAQHVREEEVRRDEANRPGPRERMIQREGDRHPVVGPRGGGVRPEGPTSERAMHVRQAIEHLHAAGLHDRAEQLEREFGRGRGLGGPNRPERMERPMMERPMGPFARENPQAAIGELRANVRQLREEMEETRRMLHGIMERLTHRDEEGHGH